MRGVFPAIDAGDRWLRSVSSDAQKRLAAARAVELVREGMVLGLGSGSTAAHFVDLLGGRVAAGLQVTGVPTSERTRAQAAALAIPISTLDAHPGIDLTIDGADEVDGRLRLIKGGGGALLREKIVAAASKRLVVIVDGSKIVATLGAFPLPVEVVPFGLAATCQHIEHAAADCGCRGTINLRRGADGAPFVSDGGHHIVDCAFGAIGDPEALATRLDGIPGIVEHGLFIGLASACIIADGAGVRVIGDLA
ncbi:MAG: ribose-5-phosphate isomerase RpiA [Methylobacteriaceae bacterium]|nr:ribose-5-phosphate isomerase RpiA [Methylobacteriaceae bacterium]